MKILSGLSNGQVLQRRGSSGATVLISGTCEKSGVIYATLFKGTVPLKGWKRRAVGMATTEKFLVKLAAIPVGGAYQLHLESGRERTTIASFFVGDVWILAGQSNMEGVGNMTAPAKPHPLIRSFSLRREWRLATDPLHILAESPDSCHAAAQVSAEVGEEMRRKAAKGVGVGIFFAREMLERSGGVPQGLLCTAHGGTSMAQWDPAKKGLGGGSLYGSMLLSVAATDQPVAGILWYQGESDAEAGPAAVYTRVMKKLVAASRRDLRLPELPWIIVQIGRHFAEPSIPGAWNAIQEQQRLLPDQIKFFETVPAIDLPLDDGIHIGADAFPRLATRLASAADRLVYGNKHESRGPQLSPTKPFTQTGPTTIEVAFDHVRGELQAAGEPAGFRIVSADGRPLDLIYRTELKGNIARLLLFTALTTGARLNYGHGRAPICNITDSRGFSLPMFGPLPLNNGKPVAFLPFFTEWNLTDVVATGRKLDRVPLKEIKAFATQVKKYPEQGFINENASWSGKVGQCFFHARVELSEPMRLGFLMGYDGPFRLWLDEKPLFTDLKGTNPCRADKSSKSVAMAAGWHDIRVGMDLNEGRAWGFFLRLARKDLTPAQIESRDYTKPVYAV